MRGLGAPIVRVAAAYAVLTLVMTWPLAAGLTSDVPGDLGDSLLNLWILGWGAVTVPQWLTGQVPLAQYWNANIFHPEPLALAFSEHLFGQVVQILPIYWLTGNLILAYNLLFLSSFALSGIGMYLLAREWLDGDRSSICWPAVVAGLIYAFVPYRIAQVAHIQSVSSQWMPFALYGFVRFIRRGERTGGGALDVRRYVPLAGGTAALLMQNWSCGYYLIYFAPFVAFVVGHQILAAGRGRDWRLWAAFGAAAAIVAAGTWPLLTLYLDAREVYGFERPLDEVIRYSADLYGYVTAPEALRVWGPRLQVFPRPEGELFFGLVPWALWLVAAGALAGPAPVPAAQVGRRRRLARTLLVLILLVQAVGLIGLLLSGGFVTSWLGVPVRATNAPRLLAAIALVGTMLLAIDPAARARVRGALSSPLGLSLVLTSLAVWLSLGPRPQSMGRPLQGLGLYGVLYDAVPGVDGLRVPARYAMIAALFASVGAGFGIATLLRRLPRPPLAAMVLALVFLIEAAFLPMPRNVAWGDGPVQPPPFVAPAHDAPAVYRRLATLETAAVVAEFPFGDPAWELRYVYYSTVHWKRLVNGYSGGFPLGYLVRAAHLARIADAPDAAWRALVDAGTTHVIVHEAAMPDEDARLITVWLDTRGARPIERFDRDVLYALPLTNP